MLDNLKFHPKVEHEFVIEDEFGNHCFPQKRFKNYADTWAFLYEKFPVIYNSDGSQDDQEEELSSYYAINITKYYGLALVHQNQFDIEKHKILDSLVFGDEEDAEEYSNHFVVDISDFIQGETMDMDLDLDALYLEEEEVSHV